MTRRTPARPDAAQPVPKSRRGQATRANVIAAAREIFVRDGYFRTRITDICERADVATGTFYTYFTDKDAAFAAVLEAAEHEMLHQPHLTDDAYDGGPAAMIEAVHRTYLEWYRDNAGIMALLYQVAAIDDHFRTVLRKRGEAFFHRNAKSIARLQAVGLADPNLDPYQASRALSSMVSRVAHGTYVLGEDTPLEVMVQTLTRLWVNALQIPNETPSRPARPGKRRNASRSASERCLERTVAPSE